MWIASEDGFVSVNASLTGDEETRHCKARRAEHLEAAFPDYVDDIVDKAETDPTGTWDYQFHLDVATSDVVDWITNRVEAVEYTSNTKGNIARRWPELSHAMMDIWSSMYEVQEAPGRFA